MSGTPYAKKRGAPASSGNPRGFGLGPPKKRSTHVKRLRKGPLFGGSRTRGVLQAPTAATAVQRAVLSTKITKAHHFGGRVRCCPFGHRLKAENLGLNVHHPEQLTNKSDVPRDWFIIRPLALQRVESGGTGATVNITPAGGHLFATEIPNRGGPKSLAQVDQSERESCRILWKNTRVDFTLHGHPLMSQPWTYRVIYGWSLGTATLGPEAALTPETLQEMFPTCDSHVGHLKPDQKTAFKFVKIYDPQDVTPHDHRQLTVDQIGFMHHLTQHLTDGAHSTHDELTTWRPKRFRITWSPNMKMEFKDHNPDSLVGYVPFIAIQAMPMQDRMSTEDGLKDGGNIDMMQDIKTNHYVSFCSGVTPLMGLQYLTHKPIVYNQKFNRGGPSPILQFDMTTYFQDLD